MQGASFDQWLDRPDDVIPTPWPAITDAFHGGVRRGATSVLAGWTSMGKSVAAMDWLEYVAALGGRCCIYLNEMSVDELTARQLAGLAGVPFGRLMNPKTLGDLDRKRVRAAYPALKVFKVPAHMWPWQKVARHMRRNRWDLACLDLLPQLPGLRDVADYDEAIAGLINAASVSNTHLIVVHQLNQGRASAIRPRPALKDLRSSGQVGNNPANVMFIHRAQEEVPVDGQSEPRVELLPEGAVILAKARNGRVGAEQAVSFNPTRMSFDVGDVWRGRHIVEDAA
jgi:replicative DNA helicase